MANYLVSQLDELDGLQCPCGITRRGFVDPENTTATAHLVGISKDSRVHYHKRLTEIYVILEGTGHLELDGERVPVRPFTSALIRPGCRHRAVGALRVIVVAIPPFDAADEHFDEGSA